MRINLFLVLVVVLLLVAAGFGIAFFKPEWIPIKFSSSNSSTAKASPSSKGSGYVAVFLTNNQVYFGKLTGLNDPYPSLTDVYYLRVQRSLQPETGLTDVQVADQNRPQPSPEPQNQLTLIKLGGELHGPTDEIKINRSEILFIEELKEDSKVVQAIKQHKSRK